jgi:hypothetical protein
MRRLVLTALLIAACVPDLGVRDSLITETTVLAVRGEPAEAAPGDQVHFDFLVATPNGPQVLPARWGFCNVAKFLGENGATSAACLEDGNVTTIAEGPATVDAKLPDKACNVFGPRVLTQDLRPRDPDVTGGYYQPVRVGVEGRWAFGLERLVCGAPTAPIDVVDAYSKQYHANQNPTLDPIALPTASRGQHITLQATWPLPAAETYVVYNPATRILETHRESMRVSWFATAGTFDADRTGRDETEQELFTDNGWTAPSSSLTVYFYAVLRDPRGGVAFQTWSTQVQ